MTRKEKCHIQVDKDPIPNCDLGAFIEGFDSKHDPWFNYKILWLLLIPFVGWFVVPMLIIMFSLQRLFSSRHRIYFFEQGVVWRKSLFGSPEDFTLRYDQTGGMRVSKTQHYTSSLFGLIQTYGRTDAVLEVSDREGRILLTEKISYQNEHEEETPDKYNAASFAMLKLQDECDRICIEHFNQELKERGYGLFHISSADIIQVGRGFIRYGNAYAGQQGLRYQFSEGKLILYPSEADSNNGLTNGSFFIPVNQVFCPKVFLLAIGQLVGIE